MSAGHGFSPRLSMRIQPQDSNCCWYSGLNVLTRPTGLLQCASHDLPASPRLSTRCDGVRHVDRIAPFRITVCGLDELADHGETGASRVLSILDPDWPVPEAFGSFGEHEKLELRFHDVIEQDARMVPPSEDDVARLLAFGRDLMTEPRNDAHLLVHCHAGISRSTASMALVLAQALPAVSSREVMQEIVRIRPKAWPNLRIIEIGDGMLSRNGEIVAAAIEVYRMQLEIRPHLAAFMTLGRRGREVAAAQAISSS